MNLNDLVARLIALGIPGYVITVVVLGLAVLYAASQIKQLVGASTQKSDEELLSADQQTFRRDLLDRVKCLEAQGNTDEGLRTGIQKELSECRALHEQTQRELSEVRNDLIDCHENRKKDSERYQVLQDQVLRLVDIMRDFGAEFMISVSRELPDVTSIHDLLNRLKDAHPVAGGKSEPKQEQQAT